jgi:hypothetical protein
MTKTPVLSGILYLAISIGLCSCATLLNTETQNIRITTDKSISGLSIDHSTMIDSFSIHDGQVTRIFDTRRSRKPLAIRLQSGSHGKTFLLPSRNSIAFRHRLEIAGGAASFL